VRAPRHRKRPDQSPRRLALRGGGKHRVSLDKVSRPCATEPDMRDEYKETSRGRLAVNMIEC